MLQSNPKCRHSERLPVGTCSFCNSPFPEKLLDICFNYVNEHLETICVTEDGDLDENLQLKHNVALPEEICERLLTVRSNSRFKVKSNFVNIFKDIGKTRLKRVKIRDSKISDSDLKVLLQHALIELDISNCPILTFESFKNIADYGKNLQSLSIGEGVDNILSSRFVNDKIVQDFCSKGCIFAAPYLKRLALRGVHVMRDDVFVLLFAQFKNLTNLDLSNSGILTNFHLISSLTCLTSLILYNVDALHEKVQYICKLKALRHLDVSQSKDDGGKYENGPQILAMLIENLPKLSSLDISGTNLAGRGVAGISVGLFASDIPGMSSRINRPFQYLGLYETSHDACLRHDIPAKLVAGNANEEQILIAALAFIDRTEMLQKVLNELFHSFRFESCEYIGQSLSIVLDAMNRHMSERNIQISGSATLFYIVKGTITELHRAVSVKRRIITTLLNAMYTHQNDETMMRNGCLTLCQFKIPSDVIFEYERLVQILLHSVHGMQQESFVQRIGIYLLNSLACQVDGEQKEKLGQLGAIDKMIWLILDRLQRGLCDDVLEVAWSTMWNVTDETPSNCRKFLEHNGMSYFLECLEKFPDKEELLRNMMGLLGNVAEVQELRHFLIKPKYLEVFSDLLGSVSDGIEVSYNAAGVLSHIASDGPEVWTVTEPSREEVLYKMVNAINRWDLNSQRNINYRSFEPILYLVKIYHTPECQQWAVWALANLTKVYLKQKNILSDIYDEEICLKPGKEKFKAAQTKDVKPASTDKYCSLVEKEDGLTLLQELLLHPSPPPTVKNLAAIVLENCRNFKEQEVQLDG